MRRFLGLLSSIMPLVIIGGLLYAGIFITPKSAGTSVRPPVIGERDIFYGIAAPGEGVIWAVGQNGKIVRSEDDGRKWGVQASGTSSHLQSIAAWDPLRALAVGNGGAMTITTDGGKTWNVLDKAAPHGKEQKYIRVRTGANGRAWVVGELGLVLESLDYGRSWRSIGQKEDLAWNDIAVSGDTVVLVGEFGKIRRSGDSGATWIEVASPVKSSLMGVSLRADGTAVAVGLEGAILVSRDMGLNWQRVSSGTPEHLFGVAMRGDGWLAVGDQGIYLIGDAEAARWELKHLSSRVYAWHTDVLARTGVIYVAGRTLSMLSADGTFTRFE